MSDRGRESSAEKVFVEAIDRVRHRGLPPKRKKLCSVCSDEWILIQKKIEEMGYNIRLERIER